SRDSIEKVSRLPLRAVAEVVRFFDKPRPPVAEVVRLSPPISSTRPQHALEGFVEKLPAFLPRHEGIVLANLPHLIEELTALLLAETPHLFADLRGRAPTTEAVATGGGDDGGGASVG